MMFPNHDIIAPGADFLVYSADGPRKADFDPSALYKGTLECKETIIRVYICHNTGTVYILQCMYGYHNAIQAYVPLCIITIIL